MSKRRIVSIGIGVVGLIVLVALLISLIRFGYEQNWTGFGRIEYDKDSTKEVIPPKTLWDWLGVLFGATAGASVAIYVNRLNTRRESLAAQREEENRQETLLQTYLDRMSDLITDKGLLKEKKEEVRAVAQARTVAALLRLNTRRQGMLMDFLRRSGLREILNDANLRGANLSGAELYEADLREAKLGGADLRRADLHGANLSKAELYEADLRGAILREASLGGAILIEADLRGADLYWADLRGANLSRAKLYEAILIEATYDDSTRWPDGFDPVAAGAEKVVQSPTSPMTGSSMQPSAGANQRSNGEQDPRPE